MNDFFYHMEGICDIYNYADDNTLAFHGSNIRNVINTLEHAANIAIGWFQANRMIVNPDKFQAMLLSTQKNTGTTDFSFEINGVIITSR